MQNDMGEDMRIVWILVLLSGDGFYFQSNSSSRWYGGWPSEKKCRETVQTWIDKGQLVFGHNVTWTCEPRGAGPAPIED